MNLFAECGNSLSLCTWSTSGQSHYFWLLSMELWNLPLSPSLALLLASGSTCCHMSRSAQTPPLPPFFDISLMGCFVRLIIDHFVSVSHCSLHLSLKQTNIYLAFWWQVLQLWTLTQNLSFIVAGGTVISLLLYSGLKTMAFVSLVSLTYFSGAVAVLSTLAGTILIEREWWRDIFFPHEKRVLVYYCLQS